MMLPPVCAPRLIGICMSATAAAEPDDEPPGVRSGSWGLVVLGPELATVNSVVVVLPMILIRWRRYVEARVLHQR